VTVGGFSDALKANPLPRMFSLTREIHTID